uniref:Uncharacterized protein n=1 Tax=Pseudomonas phage Cygsa01 TaxID=3138529 RepID=A0AAU6W4K3_9VIRU
MRSFTQYLDRISAKGQVVSFLKLVTMASRYGALPSQDALDFMRATVTPEVYTLYRGLSLTNVHENQRRALKGLEKGIQVPFEFQRPDGSQVVMHTTVHQNVAEQYASHGVAGLVMEMKVQPNWLICDTRQLDLILDREDLSEEDWAYFAEKGEVLLYIETEPEERFVVSARCEDGPIAELAEG